LPTASSTACVPPDVSPLPLHDPLPISRAQALLVDDILDLSKIVTGKLALQMHLIDFTTIIENAIETVRLAANARGIRLDFERGRSEEHTSELQSLAYLVCRFLLEKKQE